MFGYLSDFIRTTCPKYFSLFLCILCTMSISIFNSALTSTLRILSLLVIPLIFLRQFISKTLSLFLVVSFSVQVSELYNSTLITRASYTFTFVTLLIFLSFQIGLRLCITPHASPILLWVSWSVDASSLIVP